LLVYKHGLPVQSGVCHNLGLGGLFIDSGDRAWRKHETVEVEIPGQHGFPAMRLSAVVVHYNLRGAGLMFDGVTNEQRRRLRIWLFDRNPQESLPALSRAVA